MLKRIKLTYECHKDKEIELKDGFNVILGSSDSGKSSFLRAIFDLYDGAIPTDAVPRGTKEAYIMAEFVEGETSQTVFIERRGQTSRLTVGETTHYKSDLSWLDLFPPEKPDYERVSGNIPVEYVQAVGQHNLVLSNEETIDVTNIQQFSPMFFIDHSDGDRLKIANVVFGLPAVDAKITRTEDFIRTKKIAINTMSKDKSSWESKMLSLESDAQKKKALLSISESIVDRLRINDDILSSLRLIRAEVDDTYTKIKALKLNIQKMSAGISVKPKLEKSLTVLGELGGIAEEHNCIEKQVDALREKIQKLKRLTRIKEKLVEPIKDLEGLKSIKQKTSEIVPEIEADKKKIDKMDGFLYVKSALKPAIDELGKLVAEKENLKNTWASVTNTKKKLELITSELIALKEKKKELLNEADICPLCGK